MSWYRKCGKREWVTTKPLLFHTPIGDVRIPAEFHTDFFSVVPDTKYDRFKKSSVLHDFMRKDSQYNRQQADVCFIYDMIHASVDIYRQLLKDGHSKKRALRVMFRLMRVSALYMLGVSGLIGSAYIGLSRLFNRRV